MRGFRLSTLVLFLVAGVTDLVHPPKSPSHQRALVFEPHYGHPASPGKFVTRAGRSSLVVSPTGLTGDGFRIDFRGVNPAAELQGVNPLPGKSHYMMGSDPAQWRTDVPQFGGVRCHEVYPGIDLVYYGNDGELEFDFVVAPGADPASIRLALDSAGHPVLHTAGDLVLDGLRLRKPRVYQGSRRVSGRYRLHEREATFELGAYDRSQPLVIDPVLSYSTYLGGTGGSSGEGIAVDAAGNIYVTGPTASNGFPTANPMQGIFQGSNDIFVAKFDPTGSTLLFSTYIGSRGDDNARAIALGVDGAIYVAGATTSADFPLLNPLQQTYGGAVTGAGGGDAFVLKLNPQGSALLYSTYLGGSGDDFATSIAVDRDGNMYLTGWTNSMDLPTANAVQPEFGGGARDAFIAKINAAGSALVFATYLGGIAQDEGASIAADSRGQAHATGFAISQNFPTSPNASQPNYAGGAREAFVAKFDPAGGLLYSTYLGGTSFDDGNGIAIDSQGFAYVTGSTQSTNFPRLNPFQQNHGGGTRDIFIARYDPDGERVFSSFLGGSTIDENSRIALDAEGNVYLAGSTNSTNFPTAAPFQSTFRGGTRDLFVAKLAPSGPGLGIIYSTYLGGTANDLTRGIAVDAAGHAFVTGNTTSTNFPVANPFQESYNGGGPAIAFIARIADVLLDNPLLPANPAINAASLLRDGPLAPGAIVSIFGNDLGPAIRSASTIPLPTTLLETSVTFSDIPAPLFFVSRTQINAQAPFELPPGPAVLQVRRGNGRSEVQQVIIDEVSPGIFTTNRQGTGAGVIVHARDFRQVTATLPAQAGEFLAIFCTGLGRLSRPVPTGDRPPSPPPQTVLDTEATIAGVRAEVSFSGAAPGLVGVYQVNVQMPEGIPAGTHPVEITINGVKSNTVTLVVR